MAVKLLFDQNLAPRLARDLNQRYPHSAHVRDFGLQAADDEAVWTYAAAHDFIIVTKDDDFRQRSFVRGHPPKVVWVRLGNCSTADVAAVLHERHTEILTFAEDAQAALLVIGRRQ